MSDEFESSVENADGSVGLPDEGLGDTTAQTDDQARGESQTEEPDGIDLSQPMFAYTDPKTGEDRQFTGEEILALIQGASAKQGGETTETEQAAEETGPAQPPSAQYAPELPQFDPLDYSKVGDVFETMLSGGDPERDIPGTEAMGHVFGEFIDRHVFNSPNIDALIAAKVGQVLSAQEGFKKFVGEFGNPLEAKEDIAKWKQGHPVYASATDAEAYAYMQLQSLKKEMAEMKAGSQKAVQEAETKGKVAGEQATVKNLQAKRTLLRPLTGGGTGARGPVSTTNTTGKFADIKAKYDLTDPDQRAQAMAEGIKRMRGQG